MRSALAAISTRTSAPAGRSITSPSICSGIGLTVVNVYSRTDGCGPRPRDAARSAVVRIRHFAVCRNVITSKVPSSGRPSSRLRVATLAIWLMLANTMLSNRSRVPSGRSISNGRNRTNARTVAAISRSEPLPPFSRSTATTGVSPSPM